MSDDLASERVIRRRRGPFKRSRTGCRTCKRRGKKCDEMWSPEGFCQRCLAGPWECSGRSSGPSHDIDGGPSLPHINNNAVASGSDPLHHVPSASAPLIVSSTPSMRPVLSSTSVFDSSGSGSVTSGPSPLLPASVGTAAPPSAPPLAPPALNGFQSFTGLRPPATGTSGYINHTAAPAEVGRVANGFPQPLFDWPGAVPSAVLTTCPDGTLAIDAPSLPLPMDPGVQEFWNELSTTTFTLDPPNQSFNSSSRVLFLNSDRPMRQGVSLAEIYARVVESWLVGLPGPTRDYARARILALNDSNNVMRAVRYAVATAYIFLFASHPHGEIPNPRPKLVELACRGAGILDLNGERRGSGSDEDARGGGATRKLRLYVDHVSTPFAEDLESTKWTEDAVRELHITVVTTRQQLSDLLWGVIDLQLVEFIRGGAAPSYNMLALGDRLVRQYFQSDHPEVTLNDLRKPESFSLRLYALSDISRCIVQRGRKTIFSFRTDPNAQETLEDEPWSTYLGLPDSIVILLAEIVNLGADVATESVEHVRRRAEELDTQLFQWQRPPTNPSGGVDSSALVSRTIAGELWRLCAIVLLYQSVYRVGGLHPVLRRAQGEILSLLASVTRLPNGDLWGFIALPAFLAACLSVTDDDRKASLGFLNRTGPERVWLDNIALVEKVWEETDSTGHLVDWHDKMVREGLSVAFF